MISDTAQIQLRPGQTPVSGSSAAASSLQMKPFVGSKSVSDIDNYVGVRAAGTLTVRDAPAAPSGSVSLSVAPYGQGGEYALHYAPSLTNATWDINSYFPSGGNVTIIASEISGLPSSVSTLLLQDLSTFRRFMGLLASRCGQMINRTDLAGPLGISSMAAPLVRLSKSIGKYTTSAYVVGDIATRPRPSIIVPRVHLTTPCLLGDIL